MDIIRMSEVKSIINTKGFYTKTLIDHENATVKNILLDAGDVIPPHSVEVDVFFYIVEGAGTIVIGDKEFELVEQELVVCPPLTEMSVRADKGVNLSFLNVKTPSLAK